MTIRCKKCGRNKASLRRLNYRQGIYKCDMISCINCGELYIKGVDRIDGDTYNANRLKVIEGNRK